MSKFPEKKAIKEAQAIMKEFLKAFEMEAEAEVKVATLTNKDGEEEQYIDIVITGENLGALIGYLGRNLRAFQKVFSMILNRKLAKDLDEGAYVKVSIDVSGYRQKRQESLEAMAKRIREEVLASSEPVDLPAMSSYERRVIHACLTEFGNVSTESFGEGADRHVRVSPKTEE